MGFGKVVAVIGAALGFLSIILSFVLPQWFSWFKLDTIENATTTVVSGIYLTGLGTAIFIPPASGIPNIALLELFGGVFVILGSIICLVGIIKESKMIGFIGGILIILGPILLISDFLIVISDYAQYIDFYHNNILWDSVSLGGYTYNWNLWIGFFLGVASGVLGIIGGVAL